MEPKTIEEETSHPNALIPCSFLHANTDTNEGEHAYMLQQQQLQQQLQQQQQQQQQMQQQPTIAMKMMKMIKEEGEEDEWKQQEQQEEGPNQSANGKKLIQLPEKHIIIRMFYKCIWLGVILFLVLAIVGLFSKIILAFFPMTRKVPGHEWVYTEADTMN